MNESFNPQVAAEKARETYRKTAAQFEDLALNTPVSEGLRALAEKNIAQGSTDVRQRPMPTLPTFSRWTRLEA